MISILFGLLLLATTRGANAAVISTDSALALTTDSATAAPTESATFSTDSVVVVAAADSETASTDSTDSSGLSTDNAAMSVDSMDISITSTDTTDMSSLSESSITSFSCPSTCTYPNSCWPSDAKWKSLNSTIGGRLYRALPAAYPCHVPYLDTARCAIARSNWTSDFWRAQQPGGYFDTAWENGDSYCNIDNDPSVPCQQGLVPIYMARVRDAQDVQKVVNFARQNKLSTRVKGASHDFLGRSSGSGTFGIQTIDLKGITFADNWKPQGAPSSVAGQSVVTVGAGEHTYYVNQAADQRNLMVVGGSSWSVGAAGGWILGGGHSSLSPQYGLGVDNALQIEIVTPDGVLRTVNKYQNPDLFWALRGGGPGFGVVTKVTYKTHPAEHALCVYRLTLNYTSASYAGLLRTYFNMQSAMVASNFSGYVYPSPTGFVTKLFRHNQADVTTGTVVLQPLLNYIIAENAAGRPATVTQNQQFILTSYFQIWQATPPELVQEGAGVAAIAGSRLFPLSMFQSNSSINAMINLFTQTTTLDLQMHLIAGGKVGQFPVSSAAIHPSWRQASHHVIFSTGWNTDTPFSQRNTIRAKLTQQTQKLAALVPGFGSYHNEADVNEPRWYQTFWGSNYNRLLSIKNQFDPTGIFTCRHCVGDSI